MVKKNNEPLYIKRQYVLETLAGLRGMIRTTNSYGLQVNLGKVERYIERIKNVLDDKKYEDQVNGIKGFKTLDDFIGE